MPISSDGLNAADQKSKTRLERLLLNLEQAWNQGDSETYASFFTEDAVYVPRGGALWERREEIQRQLAVAFSGPLRYTILRFRAWRIRFVAAKVAIVYAAMEIVHPWNQGQTSQVLASKVCVAINDDWRIASAHHTEIA
jgi:uncharacterized protein (TIGR02246 family)